MNVSPDFRNSKDDMLRGNFHLARTSIVLFLSLLQKIQYFFSVNTSIESIYK